MAWKFRTLSSCVEILRAKCTGNAKMTGMTLVGISWRFRLIEAYPSLKHNLLTFCWLDWKCFVAHFEVWWLIMGRMVPCYVCRENLRFSGPARGFARHAQKVDRYFARQVLLRCSLRWDGPNDQFSKLTRWHRGGTIILGRQHLNLLQSSWYFAVYSIVLYLSHWCPWMVALHALLRTYWWFSHLKVVLVTNSVNGFSMDTID